MSAQQVNLFAQLLLALVDFVHDSLLLVKQVFFLLFGQEGAPPIVRSLLFSAARTPNQRAQVVLGAVQLNLILLNGPKHSAFATVIQARHHIFKSLLVVEIDLCELAAFLVLEQGDPQDAMSQLLNDGTRGFLLANPVVCPLPPLAKVVDHAASKCI